MAEQFPWFCRVICHHCLSSLLVLTSIIYHNAHFPSELTLLSDMWNLLLVNCRAGGNCLFWTKSLFAGWAAGGGAGKLEKAILSWIKTVFLARCTCFQLSLKLLFLWGLASARTMTVAMQKQAGVWSRKQLEQCLEWEKQLAASQDLFSLLAWVT